jgi:hypothetical protein
MRKLLAILAICCLPATAWAWGILPMSQTAGNPLFSDGFETNDFSLWDSETDPDSDLSVTSSQKYQGTYSMQCVHDDTTNSFYVKKALGSGYSEVWIRFFVRFNEVSNSSATAWGNWEAFKLYNDGDTQEVAKVTFKVDDSTPRDLIYMRAYYYDNTPAIVAISAWAVIAPVVDTWYEVKVQYKKGTSNDGVIKIWFNGTLTAGVETSADFWDSWDAGVVQLGLTNAGDIGSWNSLIFWVDNFAIAESDIW